MRIALISEHASPLAPPGGPDSGGQNTHVAALATALGAAGHEVRVYTRRDDADLPERVPMATNVAVVHVQAGPPTRLPKDDLLPLMGEFGRWLARDWSAGWVPQVAHAHFWMSGLATLTAANRVRVPVVQTFHALGSVKRRHQPEADTSPPQRVGYERILGRHVDRVVAQCGDEVDELLALGVPRAKIAVVPSGVDTDHFTPRGPAAERDRRYGRLLVAGRLVERKGLADLVRALPRIPGAEAVLVGGPAGGPVTADPLARELVELADRLGVADRVRLAGAVPLAEMPTWYRSADVVVCPGWYEPFGLTALEAMACAKPVVAYAVGGYRDTVVDGVTGQLVPPRDVHALADTLRRLLADPVRRMQYGAAGHDRTHHTYTWQRTTRQLLALYHLVAAGPDPQHSPKHSPAPATSTRETP